jgi:hypothetical protein
MRCIRDMKGALVNDLSGKIRPVPEILKRRRLTLGRAPVEEPPAGLLAPQASVPPSTAPAPGNWMGSVTDST